MEGSSASEYGVEDNEKFTHACGKRLLSRFASRTQARIELFQSGIAVNCDYLTHAQSSMATATCCESAVSSRSDCANPQLRYRRGRKSGWLQLAARGPARTRPR
jgi:hypothetical protein